jgi:hypothetical protein
MHGKRRRSCDETQSRFRGGLLQKGNAEVTLEPSRSEELLKPEVSGFARSGVIHLSPLPLGRSTFLLEPGGQDYVGNNSYDDTTRMDEKEPS